MSSWNLFDQPQKDEKLSQPWSHPVVLKQEPLDLESSALTTRPLLHESQWLRRGDKFWCCRKWGHMACVNLEKQIKGLSMYNVKFPLCGVFSFYMNQIYSRFPNFCNKPNVTYSIIGAIVKNFLVAVNISPLSICSQCVSRLAFPWSYVSKGAPFRWCRRR